MFLKYQHFFAGTGQVIPAIDLGICGNDLIFFFMLYCLVFCCFNKKPLVFIRHVYSWGEKVCGSSIHGVCYILQLFCSLFFVECFCSDKVCQCRYETKNGRETKGISGPKGAAGHRLVIDVILVSVDFWWQEDIRFVRSLKLMQVSLIIYNKDLNRLVKVFL